MKNPVKGKVLIHMDLYKFKSFKTVARLESFSRAAEILYLSQPAVSAQIKDLESEYKTKLFDRVGRNIRLTRSGVELLIYVNKILDVYEESHNAIDQLRDVKDGHVKLNASELPGISLLPSLMASFKKEYPQVEFTLKSEKSADIIDSIKKNQFDLGFIVNNEDSINRPDMISNLLYKDKIVLAVSKENPLSRQDRINVKDLSNIPLIVSLKDTVSRQALDSLFREYSLPFNIAYEIDSKSVTKSMVEKNLGASFFSCLEVESKVKSGVIHTLEIEGISFYRYVHVIHHRNRELSPTVKAFHEFIFNKENLI